jgi:hypothetical protein
MTNPLITFRDTIRKISPTWLQTGRAQRLLYVPGLLFDALGDALTASVKIRFPGLYSFDSLPLIGRERRIRRGRLETDATYAGRLTRWLQDHPYRGGPYALLAQLHAFYAPAAFPIDLVYRSGARYRMDADGNVVRDVIDQLGVLYPMWARWWLLFYTDEFAIPLSVDDATDIALIPREWIAEHCLAEVIVLPSGAELWDYPPEDTWDGSGTWDTADVARVEI